MQIAGSDRGYNHLIEDKTWPEVLQLLCIVNHLSVAQYLDKPK